MNNSTWTASIALRRFSKFLCVATLFLIFMGALVKSTGSGLSVPDWPTTYGRFMFAFPLNQMVGGIKYEHSHRLVASVVGLLTFCLAFWLLRSKSQPWIKGVGIAAFLIVILQGVLGGLTVKFMLPVWLSSMHGVLGQTFLMVLIFIAYALSIERGQRRRVEEESFNPHFFRWMLVLTAMIYIQLIIGNIMRHTQSGLAVPDFPTMGGTLIPTFDRGMLDRINAWRFNHNMDPVIMAQVAVHVLHRCWAFLILLGVLWINRVAYKECLARPLILKTVYWLNITIITQITLGIATVLSRKEPYTTTLHVTFGAFTLGLAFLLLLRASPLTWRRFKEKLSL